MTNRKCLSMPEKDEIRLKYGVRPKSCSQRQMAVKLGISQSSLCRILREKPHNLPDGFNMFNANRKKFRCSKNEDKEDILWNHIDRLKRLGKLINRQVIFQTARDMNFEPSKSWMSRFIRRYDCITINPIKMTEHLPEEPCNTKPGALICSSVKLDHITLSFDVSNQNSQDIIIPHCLQSSLMMTIQHMDSPFIAFKLMVQFVNNEGKNVVWLLHNQSMQMSPDFFSNGIAVLKEEMIKREMQHGNYWKVERVNQIIFGISDKKHFMSL